MDRYGLTYQKKRDLIAVYDRLRSTEGINMNLIPRSSIIDLIAKEPAPRFYIEPRTAEMLVLKHIKGIRTRMPERTQDLYEAFLQVREMYPKAKMADIWDKVCEHPAKSFYTSKRTIRDFVYGWR